ncbi:MAG: DUF1573 domain-containing protein [Candidatus Kryptoniota bacterium]
MKYTLAAFTFLLAVMVGLSIGQPKLTFVESATLDAGKIYQTGKPLVKTFLIKNIGNEPLRIYQVRTSCGCTAALLSDSVIAPNKIARLRVEFNPTGYIGEVTKYIYISSNDPSTQLATVTLKVYVAYALQPTPGYIMFSNPRVGKLDSSFVTLSNTSNKTIRIEKVESDSPYLSTKIGETILEPGKFTDLKIYILPKQQGPIIGNILIKTSSKDQPVLQIRYYAGVY